MANESVLTESQETTQSVTINDRTNLQTSTGTFSSVINTAALTTAQGKLNNQKQYTDGLILEPARRLYQER